MKRSALPSPKRQKAEEATTCGNSDPDECTDEEMELFDQEMLKSGGFEIDFKKYCFGRKAMDMDDSTRADEPKTNRDFIAILLNLALIKHNAEKETSLELGKIVSANYHPSCAITLYISFEVNDPSDGNQTKPYRAVVTFREILKLPLASLKQVLEF